MQVVRSAPARSANGIGARPRLGQPLSVLCLAGIVSLAFGAQGFAEGRAFRGCAGAVGADVAVYAAYILDSFTKPFVGRDPGRLRRRFSGIPGG